MKRWALRLMVVIALFGLFVLQMFPTLFFEYAFTKGTVEVYSQQPIDSSIAEQLVAAEKLLSKSSIYKGDARYKVFIANNKWLYTILAADVGKGAFARTNPFNNIIIRNCISGAFICISESAVYNERPLSSLIAHEVTHVNIRSEIGYIDDILLPAWKKEGVADYIANSSSYNDINARAQFLADAPINTRSFEYYAYRLIAEHFIEVKGVSLEAYLAIKDDFEVLKAEVLSALEQ